MSDTIPAELTTTKDSGVSANGQGAPGHPHIVLIVPRGEAVRNFLYSDTVKVLGEHARVTLLTVIDDPRFTDRFAPYVDRIIPLEYIRERDAVKSFRTLLHEAHFKWIDSAVSRNTWELRAERVGTPFRRLKQRLKEKAVMPLASQPLLEALTEVERSLSWHLRPDDTFVDLFRRLQPDLVFNCSHIHGAAGELPAKIAYRMGIPTVGFVFSWDNLTSRSRIFVPYHYYLVWHERMKAQLLSQYSRITGDQVFVTGTPQFDFHFDSEFWLSREELCERLGLDPARPFIFYTTGMAKHFPEEYRTVQRVIDLLGEIDVPQKPQLVVRTYVKGIGREMEELAARSRDMPDVVFPDVQWEERWYTPMYEDLAVYTSLLREAALGINPASTVTLELLMHDTPVINLGFDPPGSDISEAYRWIRHIHFDHFRPVAESGATMVAYHPDDLGPMLERGLNEPEADSAQRQRFIQHMFGDTLDGQSGVRVAHQLLALAHQHLPA